MKALTILFLIALISCDSVSSDSTSSKHPAASKMDSSNLVGQTTQRMVNPELLAETLKKNKDLVCFKWNDSLLTGEGILKNGYVLSVTYNNEEQIETTRAAFVKEFSFADATSDQNTRYSKENEDHINRRTAYFLDILFNKGESYFLNKIKESKATGNSSFVSSENRYTMSINDDYYDEIQIDVINIDPNCSLVRIYASRAY